MKKAASIFLIFLLIISLACTVSITAFAEDALPGEGNPGEGTGETTTPDDGTGETTTPGTGEEAPSESIVDKLIEKLKGFVTAEKLASLKDKLFELPTKLVDYVKNAATYENLLTIITAVALIIVIPIVFGIVVVAYITIGAMILIAGALTAFIEVILTIMAGLIVL